MKGWLAGLVVALGGAYALAGCESGAPTRTCEDSSRCLQGGIDGECLRSPTSLHKWCAYPDADCPSGLRYGVLAGDGLAQMCVAGEVGEVDAGPDGGGPDGGAIDAGAIDAGAVDAGAIDAADPDAAPGPDAAPYLVNGQAADIVLGQADFTSTFENSGGLSARSMSFVPGVASDGTRLWVYDFGNSRVLQWNTLPTMNFEAADVVLGKPSFTSTTNGPTQALLAQVGIAVPGVAVGGAKIIVADPTAARAVVWSSPPATNGANASLVLGQSSFTAAGVATSNLDVPGAVWSDGTRLAIGYSDSVEAGPSVAFWSTFPSSNGRAPDLVLNTRAITFDGPRLIANDGNRLRIWNTMPASLSVVPDVVIGQADLASDACLPIGPASVCNTFAAPVVADGRLFVLDGRGRVLVFEPVPTSSTAVAKYVIGAPDFVTPSGTASQTNLSSAQAIAIGGGYLWVASGNARRVLGFKLGPP